MKRLIVTGLLIAVSVSAQAITLSPGMKELAVEGIFDSRTSDGDYVDLTLFYGEYTEENLEIGLQAAIKSSEHVDQWRAGIRVELNNTEYQVFPFFAITLEYASFEVDGEDVEWVTNADGVLVPEGEEITGRDDDAFVAGGHVGLKYFLAENIAITGAFVYEWASEDIYEDEDGGLSETDASVRFGMRYFF
jgi:hypothetical protein